MKVNLANKALLPRAGFSLSFVFIVVGCVCARGQPEVKG